jgi:TetR/AcrR family transcriptional regulator, transcriptional repressor for nem operon
MKRAGGAGSVKREQLVDAALKSNRRRGYWGTTVEDICASAPASNGSVFHLFPNKEELAIDALGSPAMGVMEHVRKLASALPAKCAERLMVLRNATIELVKAQRAANRCLLVMISMGTSLNVGALAERCLRYFEVWCAMLERQFAHAIAEYGRPVLATAARLTEFCVSLFEESLILARVRQDMTLVENSEERDRDVKFNAAARSNKERGTGGSSEASQEGGHEDLRGAGRARLPIRR